MQIKQYGRQPFTATQKKYEAQFMIYKAMCDK